MQRVVLEPVFVLHRRAYSNSSLIVELFSFQYGRIAAVARSARGLKSRYRGRLQLFTPLLASWVGKSELKTLGEVELCAQTYWLEGDALLCGFYLNELLMRLLQREDPYPHLFEIYQQTLDEFLKNKHLTAALRLFEKRLLQAIGYGLPLAVDAISGQEIMADAFYQYQPDRGFIKTEAKDNQFLVLSGASLIALRQEDFRDEALLKEVKKLLRYVISQYLGTKPLKSRELLL